MFCTCMQLIVALFALARLACRFALWMALPESPTQCHYQMPIDTIPQIRNGSSIYSQILPPRSLHRTHIYSIASACHNYRSGFLHFLSIFNSGDGRKPISRAMDCKQIWIVRYPCLRPPWFASHKSSMVRLKFLSNSFSSSIFSSCNPLFMLNLVQKPSPVAPLSIQTKNNLWGN